MKKAFSLALLLICLFFLYQFGVNFFKNSHEVEYSIRNGESVFSVFEHFQKEHYYFEIQTGDYTFVFEQPDQFHKMKQIIEEIEVLEKNGMMCIYPNFKDDVSTSVFCSDKNNMYAYESVKNTGIVSEFSQILKDKGHVPVFAEPYQETEKSSGRITYYSSALDEVLAVWFYQGFSLFDSERSLYQSTISFDRYENTLSVMAGKYYVTPLYQDNRLYEFSSVYVFDVTNNTNFTIDLGTTLSNYTYLNGVVDEKVYLFDKNTMQQIEIAPKNKSSRILATKNEDGLYYHGEWTNRNIYDFVQNKITFVNFDDTDLRSRYSYLFAYDVGSSYYFYDGTSFYQVYKDKMDVKILLFQQSNIQEIKVRDGYIYYILGDTLYKYTPGSNIRRILKYDELLYNAANIYDVYRK